MIVCSDLTARNKVESRLLVALKTMFLTSVGSKTLICTIVATAKNDQVMVLADDWPNRMDIYGELKKQTIIFSGQGWHEPTSYPGLLVFFNVHMGRPGQFVDVMITRSEYFKCYGEYCTFHF